MILWHQSDYVMQSGYRIRNQHAIHFLTFTVVEWIDVFTRPRYKNILLEALRFYRLKKGIRIYAFVIMSNHMHLIMDSPIVPLSDIIRDYKRWTSKRIIEAICQPGESRQGWLLEKFAEAGHANSNNLRFQVWQQRNHPEVLFSPKFIRQKIHYIHLNPVRAGLVVRPETYLYSSASNYAGLRGVMTVSIIR
jgi:REP element-mobilizing transposase RayT